MRILLGDNGVEIQLRRSENDAFETANVYVETWGGKAQVAICDEQKMAESFGDDPRLITLFTKENL